VRLNFTYYASSFAERMKSIERMQVLSLDLIS
jgi:hypothetical protein